MADTEDEDNISDKIETLYEQKKQDYADLIKELQQYVETPMSGGGGFGLDKLDELMKIPQEKEYYQLGVISALKYSTESLQEFKTSFNSLIDKMKAVIEDDE